MDGINVSGSKWQQCISNKSVLYGKKKADLAEGRRRELGMGGVPEGQVLSHKMIYAEGHEFVPKEDSFIWFPCSILPGRLRLCCRHASECNQQEIYGFVKWNLHNGKTVGREMKSSMILILPCDADGLSAAVLRNTQDEKSYGDERKKDASVQDSLFLFIL